MPAVFLLSGRHLVSNAYGGTAVYRRRPPGVGSLPYCAPAYSTERSRRSPRAAIFSDHETPRQECRRPLIKQPKAWRSISGERAIQAARGVFGDRRFIVGKRYNSACAEVVCSKLPARRTTLQQFVRPASCSPRCPPNHAIAHCSFRSSPALPHWRSCAEPRGSTKITPASDRGLAGRIRSGIAYSSSKRARAAKVPERFRRSSCADHDIGPWPRRHGQFRSDMIARIRIEPLCQRVRGQA